jgi:hypothetical protein
LATIFYRGGDIEFDTREDLFKMYTHVEAYLNLLKHKQGEGFSLESIPKEDIEALNVFLKAIEDGARIGLKTTGETSLFARMVSGSITINIPKPE